jgi:DNA-binding response OmpR family regulator
MASSALQILVIGPPALVSISSLGRLKQNGWNTRTTHTLQEAREILERTSFDLVLAAESLPDGRGYDVSAIVSKQSGTLMVGVALSEASLWLPVIERGANVFGVRAFNACTLESEVEKLLAMAGDEDTKQRSSDSSQERDLVRFERSDHLRRGKSAGGAA